MRNLLETYSDVLECHYKNEHYSVRDNGAVLRYPISGKRPRPTDNKWTFGKRNNMTGYLEIASVRIHRIIATAFHGEPTTKEHVVDHIDTNKQNNRPENLRWVTRLENILLNPITVKRIEIACECSIEEFLANPSIFRGKFQEPNYDWMCTVSIQEAQTSKERLLAWAESDKSLQGGTMGDWIYNRSNIIREKTEKERIIEEQTNSSKTNEMIEKVFDEVKQVTGLSQEELSSKTKKSKHLKARVYAAKRLREDIGLSEENISKLIGISKSMVNSYINHTNFYLKDTDFYQKNNNNPLALFPIQPNDSEIEKPKKIENTNSRTRNAIQENGESKARLLTWTESDKPLQGGVLEEWINNRGLQKVQIEEVMEFTNSLTKNAKQKNWKTPTEFPCCPQDISNNPIFTYEANLKVEKIFSQNKYLKSIIEDFAISKDNNTLWILCSSNDSNAIKPYSLAEITYQNDVFVHSSLGTFFQKGGAEKQFTLVQGLEWTGDETIDDYC